MGGDMVRQPSYGKTMPPIAGTEGLALAMLRQAIRDQDWWWVLTDGLVWAQMLDIEPAYFLRKVKELCQTNTFPQQLTGNCSGD